MIRSGIASVDPMISRKNDTARSVKPKPTVPWTTEATSVTNASSASDSAAGVSIGSLRSVNDHHLTIRIVPREMPLDIVGHALFDGPEPAVVPGSAQTPHVGLSEVLILVADVLGRIHPIDF